MRNAAMKPVKGYYSILQYCPDRSRGEAANVGLILFVPDRDFLQTRISKSNDRVRRFFGAWNFDNEWLKQAKQSVVNRLTEEKTHFQELSDLLQFVRTRANELILTGPQPVRVVKPEEDLNKLFNQLVDKDTTKRQKAVIKEMDHAFHGERFAGRIEFNMRIDIPFAENKHIDIPYSFQNGKPNLIKPERFKSDPMDKGLSLAVRGDLLQQTNNNLIVVPDIDDSIKQPVNLRHALDGLFSHYDIRTIWQEDRQAFIEEVDKTAHA